MLNSNSYPCTAWERSVTLFRCPQNLITWTNSKGRNWKSLSIIFMKFKIKPEHYLQENKVHTQNSSQLTASVHNRGVYIGISIPEFRQQFRDQNLLWNDVNLLNTVSSSSLSTEYLRGLPWEEIHIISTHI